MRKEKLVYHGSNAVVQEPRILVNGYYKDFGYGFYCTNIKRQATRWALTKKGASIINSYSYTENESLKVLQFETRMAAICSELPQRNRACI